MNNFLSGKSFYLSGPIQHGDNATNWRLEPKKVLTERFGINIYDPFDDPKQQWLPLLREAKDKKDYEAITKIAKSFVRKDLCMVDRADGVISNLPYKVPTTGTIHEIINSNNSKKPTLLVCEQGKENIPLWFYGFIPIEAMFGSWEELYTYLQEVNDGKHSSNNRWDFICGKL